VFDIHNEEGVKDMEEIGYSLFVVVVAALLLGVTAWFLRKGGGG